MKIKTLGIAALVAGIVYWATRQAGRVDIGTAALSKFRLEKGGIRINVKIPVLNRSDISTRITGFLGSLRYKNNILGNIQLVAPVDVARRAGAEPEFTTLITYGSVAGEIWAMLQNRLTGGNSGAAQGITIPKTNIKPSDFTIVGTLYIGALRIDMNEKIFE